MFGAFRRQQDPATTGDTVAATRTGAADGGDGVDGADVADAVAHALERVARRGLRPTLSRLDDPALERLAAMARRVVVTRHFEGAGGLDPNPDLIARIAVEACVPLLNLPAGLDAARAVRTFIVYPSGFRVDQRWTDEDGIEHEREAELAGEAWEGGPIVLAAADVETTQRGFAVVVHEMAHVLDAANGRVNGFPDVRDPELRAAWPDIFGAAYAALGEALERDESVPVDEYALEDPAEFFAVCTETFFTDPRPLRRRWPDVYGALAGFYGQMPA